LKYLNEILLGGKAFLRDPRIVAKRMAIGAATYLPHVNKFIANHGTGGTNSGRYCYAVWLRHFTLARATVPDLGLVRVAELGPGDSLGIGLAALLSGAEHYTGLDVVPYASATVNERILDELVELFRRRVAIPGNNEFPEMHPNLETLEFPSKDIPSLEACLAEERVERIRWSLRNVGHPDSMIDYVAPWSDSARIDPASLDFVFSQAVLEHVDDLSGAYSALRTWLKPGGLMSHQIDFRCHGTANAWNGHWGYPDWMWRTIRGNRPYLLNRQPYSSHRKQITELGFRIVREIPIKGNSALTSSILSARYSDLSDADLTTQGCLVQARKGD